MNQILDALKGRVYQIPQLLLFNYRKLGLSELELIVIMYIYNDNDSINYNPKKISNDLDLDVKKVLEVINNLVEKGFLNIELIKINNVRTEVINLDLMYEKLAFIIMKKDTKKETNIFETYETELGRALSPTEYEIINSWLDSGYSEELILLALKEAVYNGVSNFRYIDRIIFEWAKKGIKNKDDVEKNRKEFKKSKENKELFDYDWLNDREDS
jgi:DNA replication protein